MAVLLLTILYTISTGQAFTSQSTLLKHGWSNYAGSATTSITSSTTTTDTTPRWASSSSLSMWWFGTGNNDDASDDNEMVCVRIDRPSPNSRRIGGDITVDAPMDDVWAILTDYDNLSTHVPNLVVSERVETGASRRRNDGGVQGDGSYACRLFQRGAQKIIGFEFAASVTMDMKESVLVSGKNNLREQRAQEPQRMVSSDLIFPEEKYITFKCVQSQFFSEFDGEWKAVSDPSGKSTTLSYVVNVRPKGPVPVAALEWRIREDVPTNLLAVKKAAQEVGLNGVLAMRAKQDPFQNQRLEASMGQISWDRSPPRRESNSNKAKVALTEGREMVRGMMKRREMVPLRVAVNWDENETMAAYLNND